jgi:hypothetical protein
MQLYVSLKKILVCDLIFISGEEGKKERKRQRKKKEERVKRESRVSTGSW